MGLLLVLVGGLLAAEEGNVPLLAASGILNGAIAWDIYRLATGDDAP